MSSPASTIRNHGALAWSIATVPTPKFEKCIKDIELPRRLWVQTCASNNLEMTLAYIELNPHACDHRTDMDISHAEAPQMILAAISNLSRRISEPFNQELAILCMLRCLEILLRLKTLVGRDAMQQFLAKVTEPIRRNLPNPLVLCLYEWLVSILEDPDSSSIPLDFLDLAAADSIATYVTPAVEHDLGAEAEAHLMRRTILPT